jgi:6-pyruvoyltetrahydropterin/6-carboxytetrahydropterin synthase
MLRSDAPHHLFFIMPARGMSRQMRMRLTRDYRFEAAHFLPKVPDGHKCARMHGHSYAVTVVIEGEVDAERGWIMDFADIDEHVQPLVRMLDHRVLNEIEGLANPTSELLAAWLWQRVRGSLPALIELQVSETPTSRCIYRGE